jgi:hypothetical protein
VRHFDPDDEQAAPRLARQRAHFLL